MALTELPGDLPVPEDDGGTDHLPGGTLPDLDLVSTAGGTVNLVKLAGTIVLFAYPMTGRPGVDLPQGWNEIPGARGCTPQSCGFRDHMAELAAAGVDHVFGVSTQSTPWQQEAADRLHLPFPLLSDAQLKLRDALRLPWFEQSVGQENSVLLKRLALVARNGQIEKVFYPVFPPDRNAEEVLAWLQNAGDA